MGILSTIFGSSSVIESGMKMLDDAFYTDSEKAEDKAKIVMQKAEHKINLLKAYAPFKIAQRSIAIVFLALFSISFLVILIATIFNIDTKKYLDAIEAFNIQWIMMTIVMFYFGAGLVESVGRSKAKVKQQKAIL